MHRYRPLRRLGRGAVGDAVLAEELPIDGSRGGLCALKCVQLSGAAAPRRRRALREAHVLRRLAHPNVLRLRRAFLHRQHLVLVSDFCDAGDLEALIAQRRALRATPSAPPDAAPPSTAAAASGFSQASVLGVFVQLARGLRYVHARGVLHRDLNASNVFLTTQGVTKLGDFGVATAEGLELTAAGNAGLDGGAGAAPRRCVGSIHHLAPEVCDGAPHSEASDCWALGVLLYHLCALALPFAGDNALAVALRIAEGRPSPLPARYSRGLRVLCGSLLAPPPAGRPTAAEVLALPLLRGAQKQPDADEEALSAPPTTREEACRQLLVQRPLAHAFAPAESERFMLRQLSARDP